MQIIIVILFSQNLGVAVAGTRLMRVAAKKGRTGLERGVTEEYKDEYRIYKGLSV
jgi:hypothetical protein